MFADPEGNVLYLDESQKGELTCLHKARGLTDRVRLRPPNCQRALTTGGSHLVVLA
jgi:hypothetical protein